VGLSRGGAVGHRSLPLKATSWFTAGWRCQQHYRQPRVDPIILNGFSIAIVIPANPVESRCIKITRNLEMKPLAKPKKKLTRAQRKEKSRRRKLLMTVFIGGKQVRIRRPPATDGVRVDKFIRQNADPIWLVQNEMYELIDEVGENQWSERR
jgi:hypothetical protein